MCSIPRSVLKPPSRSSVLQGTDGQQRQPAGALCVEKRRPGWSAAATVRWHGSAAKRLWPEPGRDSAHHGPWLSGKPSPAMFFQTLSGLASLTLHVCAGRGHGGVRSPTARITLAAPSDQRAACWTPCCSRRSPNLPACPRYARRARDSHRQTSELCADAKQLGWAHHLSHSAPLCAPSPLLGRLRLFL
eukprot:SAG11_NODE_11833_length_736_cov_0.919937_1_plen_188_part_10